MKPPRSARYLPISYASVDHPTPNEIAQAGGWWQFSHGMTRAVRDSIRHEKALQRMQQARRLAASYGTLMRGCWGWRPDVWSPGPQSDGIDPAWTAHLPVEQVREDLLAWERDGWEFRSRPEIATAFLSVLASLPAGRWPALYTGHNVEAKIIRMKGFVVDLRIAEARQWAFDGAVEVARWTGADALVCAAKLGWHSSGSPQRSLPGGEGEHRPRGGVLSASPYGPGEFEDAFGSLLVDLAKQADVRMVLNNAPRRTAGEHPWEWMPASVAAVVLGEEWGRHLA